MERFLVGDPLRGFGALVVYVFHAAAAAVILTEGGVIFNENGGEVVPTLVDAFGVAIASIVLIGPSGFLLFFALSGYLIGRPFVRALVDGQPMPSVSRFGVNRVLRVVPTYWTVLTLVIIIFVLVTDKAKLSLSEAIPLYAFQISVNSPLSSWIAQAWSLSIEVKFYVCLPIAALLAAPALKKVPTPSMRALAITLPCAVWFVAASFVYDGTGLEGQPFLYFLRMLLVGVAVAAVEPFARPHVSGSSRWAAIATVAWGLAVIYVFISGGLFSLGDPFNESFGFLARDIAVVGLTFAPLVYQWANGGCWRLIDNAPLRWLGTRAYSFYLVHLGILAVLAEEMSRMGLGYGESFLLLLSVGFLVTTLAAQVLYLTVERPFLDRKKMTARGDRVLRRNR